MTGENDLPPEEIEVIRHREGWVELSAPNREEFLDKLDAMVSETCGQDLPEEEREELRYALSEICRNAWEWGNRKDERRTIRVSYCRFDDQLVFKIEDEGEGFDPQAIPDPTRDLRSFLADRAASGKRAGGFGLHMVKKIMDQVVFNDKGNVVILTKVLKNRGSRS